MWYELPNAHSMSEFQGRSGDCMWDGLLGALATIGRAELTPAALNHMVDVAIAHGWASSNGAAPMSSVSAYLDMLGIPHTTYGYAEPFNIDWQGVVREYAGHYPLVMEVAQGGRLPGDEAGVHYHGFSILAGDPGTDVYGCCDGDDRDTSPTLKRRTMAQLAAAQPCALIVINESGHMSWTIETDAQGHTSGAHDSHGAHCGPGDAVALRENGLLSTNSLIPAGEVYYDAGKSALALDNGAVVFFSKATGVRVDYAGHVVADMYDLLGVAGQRIKQCLGQIDQLNAEIAQLKSQGGGADAKLGADFRALVESATHG